MTREQQVRISQSHYGQGGSSAHGYQPASQPGATHRPNAAAGFVAGGTPSRDRDEGLSSRPPSRAEGIGAYTSRRKKKGRRHVLRFVLAALALVLVGAGTAVGAYVLDINSRLSGGVTDELRQVLEPTKTDEPFYMLLLGVDKSQDRSEDWGDSGANFRADTIILARIDPPSQQITLVSIPRDTKVNIEGHGSDKINAAYSYGEQEKAGNGPAKMVETVEDFAGVSISHYAEIDFEQFTSIVDTVGGVEVTLPVAVEDSYANISLPAGTQTLNGEQALGLCRSRHAYDQYGGGDFYRAANQRAVIAAIVKKVLQQGVTKLPATVSELANSVTTDFNATDIVSLALQFANFNTDTGFYTGQTPTSSEYINNISYEIPIESQWDEMMERVKAGESPYSDESQDFTSQYTAGTGSGSNISGSDSGSSADGKTEPTYSGSVLVLNGAGIQGLAKNRCEVLKKAGFTATADNSKVTNNTTTTIYYNASRSGAHASALGVADKLGVDEASVKENDGTYSKDYDVVVLLGSDQAS